VGVDDATVLLNSIGDTADRVEYRRVLTEHLEERKDELSSEAAGRIRTNPLRVLDSKADTAVVADAPVPTDHLGSEAAEHFDLVRRGLDRVGIPYRPAPRLVRGLDYYNRTVFEYESPSYEAAQASLGGGGRYDPLAAVLGGPDVPAVGLAMGVDRIVLAMPEVIDRAALDAFVVVADPTLRDQALGLVAHLRSVGLRADLDLGDRSVKAQFRTADRRRAGAALVVGEEWRDGRVALKRLASGEEVTATIEEAVQWLRQR
jgi:histidyl-tRNA synthetase